jgi:hypothetical protein
MISSAATTNYRGSVHDGGHMPVVFVGVTALVLPTQRDHSSDADIGLGLLVPHPRPFRWWILEVVDCHMVFVLWPLLWFLSFLGFVLGFSVHIPFFRFHFGFAP